jgi:DNA-binding transcriptional ArsR family regulator
MHELTAARALEALGQAKRLALYRLLVKAGTEGLNMGDLQQATGIPASTLSHHVTRLCHAGLVTQERFGREIRCRVDYRTMHGLVGFLTDQCCVGVRVEMEKAEEVA